MKSLEFDGKSEDKLLLNIYGGGDVRIAFGLCKKQTNGRIKQLKNFYYCRESVMHGVPDNIKHLSNRSTWLAVHKSLSVKGEAPKEKHEAYKKHIKKAIKLLNHYEKRNNWVKSVAFIAEHERAKTNPVYIIKSSKWWIHSPHLFSLYMLLIRICRERALDNIRTNTTNEKILEYIKSIPSSHSDYTKTRNPEFWNVLVDKRREIYDGRTVRENFNIVSRFDCSEGVLRLSRGTCNDYQTRDRFIQFCKEAGIWK